jgi:hypothetical protein
MAKRFNLTKKRIAEGILTREMEILSLKERAITYAREEGKVFYHRMIEGGITESQIRDPVLQRQINEVISELVFRRFKLKLPMYSEGLSGHEKEN